MSSFLVVIVAALVVQCSSWSHGDRGHMGWIPDPTDTSLKLDLQNVNMNLVLFFAHQTQTNNNCGIHGLWPGWAEYCPSNDPSFNGHVEDFDICQLASIRNDLNTYWPSNKGADNNPYFWCHEWSRHGSCAGYESQLAFFSTVLAQYQ